ncbi:nuclease-related domain-containing protein [Alkaliphilus serpentinus]|uniref:NERD domain-containing protein n=1 Tax=Alkaliphilus serpentinus TaxID=1482731 RepID=A0A833MAL9_9FIRM|nr:nuclease-related domain-containing protein [Alkaliphilus serpentinus]KAB3532726.1 NERD domain-containing protein [Alkaliphilus serpentinus]
MSIIKKTNKPLFDRFLKDPLWMYLLGISSLTFLLVDSVKGYILAGVLLVLSIITIYNLYLEKTETLHQQVLREFKSLNEDFTVLSEVKLQRNNRKGYSDFIVISAKGVFNICLLDFEGAITGFESDTYWQLTKLSSYDVTKNIISNPMNHHKKSHGIIEDLLAENNIKYIPIQTIVVIRNEDAEIITNSTIPIIKVKNIRQYISQYSDRQNMHTILDEVIGIMKSQVRCC